MLTRNQQKALQWVLVAGLGVVGIGIAWLSYLCFLPIVQKSQVAEPAASGIKIPVYNYQVMRALPVQHGGRYKPFESAATEELRLIHGRTRLQGQDALPVVLAWMLGDEAVANEWDSRAFLLCENQELRRLIYANLDSRLEPGNQIVEPGNEVRETRTETLTSDQLHGKYVTPAEVREFRSTMSNLVRGTPEDKARFDRLCSPVQRQADELLVRLAHFEAITQNDKVQKYSATGTDDVQTVIPFAFVSLTPAPLPQGEGLGVRGGAPWFSLGQLRQCLEGDDAEDARKVLTSYADLQRAYRTGDAVSFDEASGEFATTVGEVSSKAGPYPGEDTIGRRVIILLTGRSLGLPGPQLLSLERQFNRVQPFMWAWVVMLAGIVLLCTSLAVRSPQRQQGL